MPLRNGTTVHVVGRIVPLGNGVGTAQQRTFKVTPHKGEVNLYQLYTCQLTMQPGTLGFACVVVGAVTECHGKGDVVGIVMQHSHRVHTSRQYHYSIFLHDGINLKIVTERCKHTCLHHILMFLVAIVGKGIYRYSSTWSE